jgi:Trypsin-like peptidase domain
MNKMKPPEAFSYCYERTLRIETDIGGHASSFVINYRDRDWLVTASHIVENRETGDERPFKVLDKKGKTHTGLEPLQSQGPADVAVFHLWTDHAEDESYDTALEPHSAEGVCPTQDVYLLGYPDINDQGRYRHLSYAVQPSPLIMRAMVSGDANYYGIKAWLLDGTARHGFSGGPVVLYEPESDSHQVLGVISGHVPARAPFIPGTLHPDSIQLGGALPFCEINSGLSICFSIQYALTDIDAHLATK